MGELGFCTIQDILTLVKNQLLADSAADFGIPIFIVRLLHNKVFNFLFDSSRCYLLYFDIVKFTQLLSPFLLPFVLYALLQKKARKMLWLSLLLLPFLFIFTPIHMTLQDKINLYKEYFILIAILGFMKMVINLIRPCIKQSRL